MSGKARVSKLCDLSQLTSPLRINLAWSTSATRTTQTSTDGVKYLFTNIHVTKNSFFCTPSFRNMCNQPTLPVSSSGPTAYKRRETIYSPSVHLCVAFSSCAMRRESFFYRLVAPRSASPICQVSSKSAIPLSLDGFAVITNEIVRYG